MESCASNGVPLNVVHRIAYRIGRVIAAKAIQDNPRLRAMDGLAHAAAVHTMATNMTNELLDEATAAWGEALLILETRESNLGLETDLDAKAAAHGDEQAQQRAYDKAAAIADILLRDRVPLLAYAPFDMGASLGFVFQLDGQPARYACRVPTATATAESVRELYETVR